MEFAVAIVSSALKTIFDKGLLYRGHKVLPWCPSCQTALSSHEVGQGYKDVRDPSIYVTFRSKDDPGVSFLAWTTTCIWVSCEALIAHRKAKRRSQILLSRPSVVNRYLLCAGFGGFQTFTAATWLVIDLEIPADGYRHVMDVLLSVAEIGSLGMLWLAFASPEFYRAWIDRESPASNPPRRTSPLQSSIAPQPRSVPTRSPTVSVALEEPPVRTQPEIIERPALRTHDFRRASFRKRRPFRRMNPLASS